MWDCRNIFTEFGKSADSDHGMQALHMIEHYLRPLDDCMSSDHFGNSWHGVGPEEGPWRGTLW